MFKISISPYFRSACILKMSGKYKLFRHTLYSILIIILSFAVLPSYAGIVRVGKNQAIQSVQQGILQAKEGDTIYVHAGIYHESKLIIEKSITLVGKGWPVIDAQNKGEIFFIRSRNVWLQGFKLQHTGRSDMKEIGAVMIYDSYAITVYNNQIEDANFGISVQNSKRCTIKDNHIKAFNKNEVLSGNGIHGWKADSLIIIGNTISGHRDGLYFEFVKNSLIWRNKSTENVRYGIHFMFSNNNTYIGNIFEKNESGVAVMFSSKIQMYNNYFHDNWGDATYGILLKEITDSHISGNSFVQNTIALQMEGCSRIKVFKNKFINNGFALKIQASCDDNDFTHNNFIANTFDIATNGTLVLNTFDGNYWDKYEGYDLDRNKIGDISFHPVSLYSMIIAHNPAALMLFRSFMVTLLDKSEKLMPIITPESLVDHFPHMKPFDL